MGLNAGNLRHRIEIQEIKRTKDATGSLFTEWVSIYKSIPAKFYPSSVKEFIASKSEHSEISARFVIRYRPDINSSMRIICRGQVYNILGVLPDPYSGLEYLTLPVSSGVNDG